MCVLPTTRETRGACCLSILHAGSTVDALFSDSLDVRVVSLFRLFLWRENLAKTGGNKGGWKKVVLDDCKNPIHHERVVSLLAGSARRFP
jgi:hypothetical protein